MTRRTRMLAALLSVLAAMTLGMVLTGEDASAARVSDIRKTKHNLSASSGNNVRAQSETEVCVFCHTPHQTSQSIGPLWNHTPSANSNYNLYNSNSLDAAANGVASLDQPDGSSKLCLSCHDGTVALGNVNILRGKTGQTITMQGGVTTMGTAGNATVGDPNSGYTRVIGTDLSNDHPISFTYDPTRASNDGELYPPTQPNQVATRTTTKRGVTVPVIGSRGPGAENKPVFPLENQKMQCTTCHDPHIRDDTEDAVTKWTPTEGPIKFLRESRMQQSLPAKDQYTSGQDILCLGCHNKTGWYQSAHAVATQTYLNAATTTRQFPASTQVWQAACLNCHDTHTVQGARRLLRDGTDGALNAQNVKSGGNAATEQTCYACHSPSGGNTVNSGGGGFPPDVKSDFASTNYSMPIANTPEVHDVGTTTGNVTAPTTTRLDKNLDHLGANGIEGRDLLSGAGNTNRHAECPDCHNPHRTMKSQRFWLGVGSSGHHLHDDTSATQKHDNIASGALRGAWGVEPDFGTETSVTFGTDPTNFKVKFGDPGVSQDTSVTNTYVTREYQICLKCHSNYAYGSSPPTSGPSINGKGSNINGLTQYTNQAMEFASPSNDSGEPGGNHRSWHPVRKATGRTTGIRVAAASNWAKPWSNDIGNNTMYCTDCHGSSTGASTVVPAAGQAWGPHGSANPFILKGDWKRTSADTTYGVDVGNNSSGSRIDTNGLCFKCHSSSAYAYNSSNDGGGFASGFSPGNVNKANLHLYHANKLKGNGAWRCTFCHVAVPHGW
ncbi:MAG: hypothetical protein K2X44_00825, partial [Magnetospirillum sp.]|nr:hypothetical protein [Magnetospirillum sp.]